MWYVISAEFTQDCMEARSQARPAHLQRLRELQDEGRLLVAGPIPKADSEDVEAVGVSGSLVIAAFDQIDSARAWAQADPYALAGIYTKLNVNPFKKVLP